MLAPTVQKTDPVETTPVATNPAETDLADTAKADPAAPGMAETKEIAAAGLHLCLSDDRGV